MTDGFVVTLKPVLNDVTLCCIDPVQPMAAPRALWHSARQCTFAATVLLTDRDLTVPDVEVRRIVPLEGLASYSRFVLKHLISHVATQFVLLVQWDGYVADGARREDGFRQFDYMGATWPSFWPWITPGQEVGNGGFSLRSRRLLEVLADDAFPDGHPEDVLICQTMRTELDRRGIRFADPATATRFSVEHDSAPEP